MHQMSVHSGGGQDDYPPPLPPVFQSDADSSSRELLNNSGGNIRSPAASNAHEKYARYIKLMLKMTPLSLSLFQRDYMNSLGRKLSDQYGPENGETSPRHTNGPTDDNDQ